ncbi:hypothetical protein [Nocardia sp. NPDC048505]|uniref:hypothetical protein n=1 Tax=unclassified Nocardia TaxID=2637762 RepID=UPI0033FCE343
MVALTMAWRTRAERLSTTIEIRASIGSRDQVRAWEARRADAVLEKLASYSGPRAWVELLPEHTLATLRAAPAGVRRAASAVEFGNRLIAGARSAATG